LNKEITNAIGMQTIASKQGSPPKYTVITYARMPSIIMAAGAHAAVREHPLSYKFII
jgi:hypothetical protein